MANRKQLKRELKKVWDALKQELRERSKLTGAPEVAESAQRLASHASQLTDLAKRLQDTEAAAQTPALAAKVDPKPKVRKKAKPAPTEPETVEDQ